MRIENWNPEKFDEELEGIAMERLVEAGEVVAEAARRKCPVGTITRPIARRGRYAGQWWTARDAGALKRTIRVVRKLTKSGKAFSKKRDVRVYAGTRGRAWYARLVEYYRPFMRPAFYGALSQVKQILGVK